MPVAEHGGGIKRNIAEKAEQGDDAETQIKLDDKAVRVAKTQAVADVAAKIFAEIFGSVAGVEQGGVVTEIMVNFLPVRNLTGAVEMRLE